MDTQHRQFWLGTGIGILGLVPSVVEYIKKDFQLATLYSLPLLILFLWFFASYRSGRGPHYETLLMKKVLTIKDPQGKLAEARCEQRIRTRYGNLHGIWRKNNVVDGCMNDFKVDGKPPDEIDKLGSNMSFYKRFTIPLSKGEERDVVWTFQAVDSLLSSEEAFLHDTTIGTKVLEMEVIFPDERGFTSASFHEEVGGEILEPLPGLEKIGQKKLAAKVKSPKPGHTYRIDWTW